MTAAEFGKRLIQDIKGDQYRQQLAQHQQAGDWARFRTSYPEPVWRQMSEPQQAAAWLSWQQNDQLLRATKKRGKLVTVLVVLAVIVAVIILL